MARFKRILLKLSGESLMGEKKYGIDEKRLGEYAQQIKEIHEMGVQIGIVIGGGNIFRGLSGAGKGFDRVKGDQMGMLATVINSLGLSSALVAAGVKARVLTAIRMEPIGEFYTKWKAIEAMENGEVVIMSAGTGNPFFTTDTGSSLRGIEIEADVMLKGTRVDGIYTADPEKDPTATKFDEITYDEVLARGLKVMDLTATCMCKENNLPIIVFDMDTVGKTSVHWYTINHHQKERIWGVTNHGWPFCWELLMHCSPLLPFLHSRQKPIQPDSAFRIPFLLSNESELTFGQLTSLRPMSSYEEQTISSMPYARLSPPT